MKTVLFILLTLLSFPAFAAGMTKAEAAAAEAHVKNFSAPALKACAAAVERISNPKPTAEQLYDGVSAAKAVTSLHGIEDCTKAVALLGNLIGNYPYLIDNTSAGFMSKEKFVEYMALRGEKSAKMYLKCIDLNADSLSDFKEAVDSKSVDYPGLAAWLVGDPKLVTPLYMWAYKKEFNRIIEACSF